MSATQLTEEEYNALSDQERRERKGDRTRTMGDKRRGDLHQKISYLPDIHRLLPQAPDAERGVLSSWLLAPNEVGGFLRDKHFRPDWLHLPAHAEIANELEAMRDEIKPIDFVTLTQRLRDRGVLDQVGGAALVTELFTFLPTAANAGHYLEIVEEKQLLREIIRICTEYAARSYDEQDDPAGLLAECEERIAALSSGRTKRRRKSQGAVVLDICDMIERGNEEAVWGIKTGFPNLDLIARGLRPGNVIAIGGNEKAGKTALAQNIVNNVCVMAKGDPVKTLFFSLENTTQEVNEELLQIGSGYNLDEIIAAKKYPTHGNSAHIMDKVTAAAMKLAKAPLEIRDEAELSIMQMRSIARQYRPRLIVLDYAQLCAGVSTRYERDELRIAEVSRHFKLMCGELDATGILLSQLTDGKAAGSRSIVKDCNQWWVVEDGACDQAGNVVAKTVKICAGRRVQPAETSMRWIGPIKKMLPGAI